MRIVGRKKNMIRELVLNVNDEVDLGRAKADWPS